MPSSGSSGATVTSVHRGACVLHFDGGVAMQPRFLEALSAGGCAVVHSSNGGKPIHLFHWYEDGELRTRFEWPTARGGSTPDALNSVMGEVGFNLFDDEGDTGVRVDTEAAVLALAERLTGVRVTEELLQDANYQLGHVPMSTSRSGPASSSTLPTPTGNASTRNSPARRSRPP
ncbi:DUF6461 domain-containing protein [Streptomyces sp. NPDC000994]